MCNDVIIAWTARMIREGPISITWRPAPATPIMSAVMTPVAI
jgi:hypothetical protein